MKSENLRANPSLFWRHLSIVIPVVRRLEGTQLGATWRYRHSVQHGHMGHNSAALGGAHKEETWRWKDFRELLPPLTCLSKSHIPCFIHVLYDVARLCWSHVSQTFLWLRTPWDTCKYTKAPSFKEPGPSGDSYILEVLRTPTSVPGALQSFHDSSGRSYIVYTLVLNLVWNQLRGL